MANVKHRYWSLTTTPIACFPCKYRMGKWLEFIHAYRKNFSGAQLAFSHERFHGTITVQIRTFDTKGFFR
ncbi:hypothetical protein DWY22_10825 [Heyndrickxia coagulans]|nr:hypothetical protein DWY22_10825 [Heyndrickxia coagulans]RGR96508.1 hypothetical protein DWY16_11670 [Heyndrickxia coagulans]